MYYGEDLSPALTQERKADRRTRGAEGVLGRILAADSRPLSEKRVEQDRFSGSCRDYALLACMLLRYQGRPARLRCGFAAYFTSGFYEDHWLCEAWAAEEGRWRLLDAQLDAERCERHGIAFDPTDVPRDGFLTAGRAWQAWRSGALPAKQVGLTFADIHGPWFMAGSLLRDLAAMNKREMQPWDYWGLGLEIGDETTVRESQFPLLDEIAAATTGVLADLDRLQTLYRRPELSVPNEVVAYPYGEHEICISGA